MNDTIAFIGGGNMASAILGGLLRAGTAPQALCVVEPWEPARQALQGSLGLAALPAPDAALAQASTVVWAVKPQVFRDAAAQARPFLAPQALHISVAAGIGSDAIARWLGSERVVRTMPNTPALIGKGITGLFARAAVSAAERVRAERIVSCTGDCLWLEQEAQLDAVTALSGSGPAYMFYVLEAMSEAGVQLGLERAQAYRLAVATCIGAGELARASQDAPEVLRQRVTSKGGTTHAAISTLEAGGVKDHFIAAMQAAYTRAGELGREFGAD